MLHVATLPRSLVSLLRYTLLRYMLLRCRDLCFFAIQSRLMLRGPAANNSSPTLWVPGTKMSCCMPRCGNGDSLTSTRSCLRKLHRCCEKWSEKDACTCPIEIDKKITFYCSENTICIHLPKKHPNLDVQISHFSSDNNGCLAEAKHHFFVKLYFHEHGFRSGGMF